MVLGLSSEEKQVTSEEHQLMLLLFVKQQQSVQPLLEILRSRGILTADDDEAFASAHMQDKEIFAAILAKSTSTYQTLAESLGISVDLGQFGQPSPTWLEPPDSD